MKFQYVCRDVRLSPSMEEACRAKIGRFDHYFRSTGEVNCVVSVSIIRETKVVEVTLTTTNNFVLRAKDANTDFYIALDTIAEKLERQMRKMKTQLEKVNKQNSLSQNLLMEQIADASEAEEDFEIVKRKKLSLVPMDVDEALARMDAIGHKFYIYLDSTTGLVNVLYERDDHGYGVIEIEEDEKKPQHA
jgi:putative sigma-54 modulation protein